MILISLDPKDSFETTKTLIQKAINDKFSPDAPYTYEIQNTWPESVIVRNYDEGKFYEIPYSKDVNGVIQIGDASEATNIYVATKETLINSMKDGHDLILINGGSKPQYRALVQTPSVLNYKDLGYDVDIEYTEEAIKKSINELVGFQIHDETLNTHARIKGNSPIAFADIVNAGYCPNYGGYVDFEVFRPEYEVLMTNAFENAQKGIQTKQGFSTEVGSRVIKKDDGTFKTKDIEYRGLVWTNKPRDSSAQVCDILLNSEFDFKGDDNLTKIEIEEEELNGYKAKIQKLTELEDKFDKLEAALTKGKDLYDKAQSKITELTDTLNPFLEAQETQKAELINSILEVEPERKKEDLEGMGFGDVQKIQLINSIVSEQPKGKQGEVKTQLETLEIGEINNLIKFGLLNSTEGGGSTGGATGLNRGRGRPKDLTPEEAQYLEIKESESENKDMIRR